MKAFIYKKLLEMPPRARTKLVEVFGKRYWQEMSPEEFKHRFEIMCTRCDTVKTKRDFENFLRDKMEVRVPMEKGPTIAFTLVPDFDENTSYLFVTINHAWVDGVQLLALCTAMSENKDQDKPFIPGLTFSQKLVTTLMVPVAVAKLFLKTTI